MIFRLEYCNKASVTARVDIQKGGATPIYTVEGTAEPFVLFYNNDKGDKSGSFRSSGADINIYETAEFNIDELKTSNETEISVKYYINDILNWSGFVIPDFFSETITGGKGVVSMVASDRLGTLKGATLSGLSAKVSNRELAEDCLAQTGLSLPLYTMADFTGDGTNIFNSEVLSQRMVDTKGRNVSCYDILSSILEETNSLIVQRNGAWYIVNKLQLEAGSGILYSAPATSSAWVDNTVSFDEVSVGARRTIKPVAATVGVYHEHGGGRLHPDNYDFSLGVAGWTSVNGFVATTDNREIELYSNGTPIYGDATSNDYLVNNNERVSGTLTLDTAPYLESASIPVVSTQSDMVDISIDISITAPGGGFSSATPSFVRYAVIASNGTQTYALNRSGTFEVYDPTNLDHSQTIFIGSDVWGQIVAASKSQLINGKLEVDLTGFNVRVRIYGSGTYQTTAIHFASIRFSNTAELPKGNIFKTTQGANYTKDHDIQTVLWGDYLTSGLNGYFYDYPIDDTSSLYRPTGELHSGWTAYGDPDTLPLLQHITRQKSRMFSVAHDLLSADITASTFDPLSIFIDCDSTRYVVVSARFDFLRSNVSVELEEVAYATNSKRDYIYSYFGDGEEGIRSIGGISGGTGGGSTGGGLTSEQLEILSFWKKDPENPNTIFTEMNAYSKLELSAYGAGDGGGGGGSDYERLDTWASYDSSKAEWVLSAFLGNDLNTRVTAIDGRVTDLENSAGSGSVTSVGISVPTGLSVSNSPITSSGVIAIGLQTGYSIPTTVKQGQWDTAFTNNHTHSNKTVLDGITSALVSNWNTAFNNNHTHSNKTQLDLITQSNIDVLAKLSIVNGNLQIDGNAYATGELSAYGAGDGGSSGGGGSLVTWGTLTNGYRQLTVEGVTYALAQNTHKHLWADITDKPSTFTPSAHSHGWSEITGKPSTFTPSAHSHGWSEITGKPSTFTPSSHTHSAGNITSGTFAIERIPTGTTGTTVALGNHLHTGVYEPVFSKNTAFNKDFGTVAGTVAEGNHTHSYLPLSGGTLTGNINITPTEGTLGVRTHRVGGSAYMWPYGNSLSSIRTGLGFGWYDTEWIIGNIRGAATDSYGFGIGYRNADGDLNGEFRIAVGGIAYLNNVAIATVDSNVASATKLQTARTIAGVSFDGTDNIAIPFANLSSKPNTLGGYGITDAVTLNTTQTITGAKTFDANITLGVNRNILGTDNYTGVWNVDNKLWRFGSSSTGSVSNIRSEKVGVGTDSPSEKLHVVGNILATGTTATTKVIFNSAGWSMEQTGTELLLKYNDLTAARFLSDGSIVGLGEITAYGATTGGEGVALLRTGGTMTGPIRWATRSSKTPFIGYSTPDDSTFTIAIDGTTWQSGLSLGGTSGNLLWKGSQVLDKANTANKIEMGNGWTIEQTISALTIKKNGVVKGTFNA